MKQYLLFASLLLTAMTSKAQFVITTYAGTPQTGGYYGDGGPATSAQLGSPSDIALDNAGNLYIADFVNNVIRKVDVTTGIISNFAGTGFGAGGTPPSGSFSGDNGPATDATLNGPFALAVDKTGNVVFADGYNHVVRKVSTAGIITTIAGKNTMAGYSGDGGPATDATLDNPVGIAIDTSGNIYVADDHNNVVRMITPAGIISTFAGDSTAGHAGNGGPATAALLDLPIGVATDKRGNVYIADENNNIVRKVDATGIITDYAGGPDTAHGYSGDEGAAATAKLFSPSRLTVDASGNLYIADALNSVIRIVSPEGTINTFAGTGVPNFSGDGGLPDTATMNATFGVAVNSLGYVYIADRGNEVIRRVGPPLPNSVIPVAAANAGLNIYPNPAHNGIFTINVSTGINEEATITIMGITGQTIMQQVITTNNLQTLKAAAPAGVYLVNAVTQHGNWNTRLIVE